MVAVVGTLLALLVFFALFGIFITQYVPLWMEQNESALAYGMQSSLATLKSGVDDQYLLGNIPTYSVPFQVSSNSVPLFAQPTVATISILSGCPDGFYSTNGTPVKIASCDFNRLSYTTGTGASGSQNHPYTQTVQTEYLEATLPNRYFTAETYFFESDGLVGEQSSGHAWTLVPPPLNISKAAGNLTVTSSILILLGNTSSFTGIGSKDVASRAISSTTISSAGRFLTPADAARTFNLTLTLGVHDICAWYNFLNATATTALGPSSSTTWKVSVTGLGGAVTTPISSTVCLLGLTTTYDVTLNVYSVNYASTFLAQDGLGFNAGGL